MFKVGSILLHLSFVFTTVHAKIASNKILCLHGGNGDANNFQSVVAALENALPEFEFVYVNGGYPSAGGYVWISDPPGGKEEPTTDPAFADDSVDALDTVVASQGPFYGILGYSQGAAFVPVYLSRVPHGTFQIALTFCGYLTTTHLGILDVVNSESPFGGIPALVWMGSADWLITNAMTRDMATKFTDPTIIVSNGAGHVVPQSDDGTFSQVTSFVRSGVSSRPPTDPTISPTVSSPMSSSSAPGVLCKEQNAPSLFLWMRSVLGVVLM